MRFPLCLIIAAAWGILSAAAAEVKVIANESIKVSEISVEELQRVFLAKTNSLHDGSHVEPVLGLRSAAHEIFLRQYLGKTDAALSTYFRALVFTGKGFMPKLLGSDAEVVAYVSKNKGALGYVSAGIDTTGTRALTIK